MVINIKKIVILGTGGNCIDILESITESKSMVCVGFLDDNQENWGKKIHGINIIGPLSAAPELPDSWFLVNGIGSSANYWEKEMIIAKTQFANERFMSVIHPTAWVSKSTQVGNDVVILANVTVASNVRIGNHVIILPNSVISHDVVIEDYSIVTSGVCISGGVHVGRSCYIGTNSAIIENVSIGSYSLVGMGSIVLESIPDKTIVVGNPSRKLRSTPF